MEKTIVKIEAEKQIKTKVKATKEEQETLKLEKKK